MKTEKILLIGGGIALIALAIFMAMPKPPPEGISAEISTIEVS